METKGIIEGMERFYMVEKRVPIFESDVLKKLGEIGVQVSGGKGVIHAHIWIPEGREMEVLNFLKTHGFSEISHQQHDEEKKQGLID